jgi:predicted transcriptional regulator
MTKTKKIEEFVARHVNSGAQPRQVHVIAKECGCSRGLVYRVLKRLQSHGLHHGLVRAYGIPEDQLQFYTSLVLNGQSTENWGLSSFQQGRIASRARKISRERASAVRDQRILALRSDTIGNKKIAELLGVSRSCVDRSVAKLIREGLSKRLRSEARPMGADSRAAYESYCKGLSYNEIAEKHGWNVKRVENLLNYYRKHAV